MARGAAEQENKLNTIGDTQTQNAQNVYNTALDSYKGVLAAPGFTKAQIGTQTKAALTPIAGQIAGSQAKLGARAAATRNTAGMVSGERDLARTGAQLSSQAAFGVQENADQVALNEADQARAGIAGLYSPTLNSAGNLYSNATNAMNSRQSVLGSIGQGVGIASGVAKTIFNPGGYSS